MFKSGQKIIFYQAKVPCYRYAFFKKLHEYFGKRFELYHSDGSFANSPLAIDVDAKLLRGCASKAL